MKTEREYKYKTFKIVFENNNHKIDETQFDIAIGYTLNGFWFDEGEAGMFNQLLELWEEFKKENGLIHPYIGYVDEVPFECTA